MKKALKIFVWIIVIFLVSGAGFGLYLYNTNSFIKAIVDNDESKLFYFPTKKMESLEAFRYEEIPLQLEDSVTIYSYFFNAETDSVKATVFFLHGSGGNVSRYKNHIRPLVENGYQVYAVDWRGFGKSNGRPLHVNVLEDSKTAFRDMLAREEVQSTKVMVMGLSMGGQVAVRLTRDFEEQVDALVLDGSITSFPSVAIDNSPNEFLKQRAQSGADEFNQPYIAAEDIKAIQNTPKLIIQSANDEWVNPERGKTLYANAQAPKDFWQTEGKHIYTLIDQPEQVIARIDKLLQEK